MQQEIIPPGYRRNAQGHLVPESQIKPIDLIRDELVRDIFARAENLADLLAQFKTNTHSEVQSLISVAATDHRVELGGQKGNLSLVNYSGTQKLQIANQDNLEFTEELHTAKALIDQCLESWSQGANDNLKTMVQHAFSTDATGKLNVKNIMGLRRYNIQDPKWQKAMQHLIDAVQVIGSKTYIRLYHRPTPESDWQHLPLSLANAQSLGPPPAPTNLNPSGATPQTSAMPR